MMTHFFVTNRDARSPNTNDDSLDESHLEKTMITKKDLEKDGWRISDEGFDYLIGQFDDEPTYQVSIICSLKKTDKNIVLETVEILVRVYD